MSTMSARFCRRPALAAYRLGWTSAARRRRPGWHLPVRPRPIVGESAHGYLVRVADGCGLESPSALWRALERHGRGTARGLRWSLRLHSEEWLRLRGPLPSYCRIPLDSPGLVDKDDLCHSTMRWCPTCLQESLHLRSAWTVKLVCACVRHQIYLAEDCPQCRQGQPLERSELAHCKCGFDLRRVIPCALTEHVALVQRCINGAVESNAADESFGLTAQQWLKALRTLAKVSASDGSRSTGQAANLHRLPNAVALASEMGTLLSDWPAGLFSHLSIVQSSAARAFSIQRTFGRFYKWLYVDLRAPCFQFLRDGFEAYLHEHWWGLVNERNRRLESSSRREHPRHSVKDLAERTGAAPSVIRQLHLGGWIDGDIVQLPSGREAWSMPAAAAVAVESCVKDGINLQEAAAILGIGKRRVRELAVANVIKPRVTARRGGSAWLLSRSEVTGLAQRCLQARSDTAADGDATVPLMHVLKAWRLVAGEFPLLVSAILAGEVRVAGQPSAEITLGGLSLTVSSARLWRARRQESDREWLSVEAASRVLHVKQEVGYQLVRCGLLESSTRGSDRRRQVHRSAIDLFSTRYVALSEIAQARDRSPRDILKNIKTLPVCGPTVDGVRQYFFLRKGIID